MELNGAVDKRNITYLFCLRCFSTKTYVVGVKQAQVCAAIHKEYIGLNFGLSHTCVHEV